MNEIWLKLKVLFGLGLPPEKEEPVNERAASAEGMAPAVTAPGWPLRFETVLPVMGGYAILPVRPGYSVTVPLGPISLAAIIGKFSQITAVRADWPDGADPQGCVGEIGLQGAGWSMQLFVRSWDENAEYLICCQEVSESVSGRSTPDLLLQALLLWPDGLAVLGFLKAQAFGGRACQA